MKKLIVNFQFLWERVIGPHWSVIIPALFVLMAIVWLIAVYARGKFRFLPALAIARVTVLDSIGRMEVIILLAMGMLMIGVPVIVPKTDVGMKTFEDMRKTFPFLDEQLENTVGIKRITLPDETGLPPLSDGGAGAGLPVSVVENDVGGRSVVGDEGVVISTEGAEPTDIAAPQGDTMGAGTSPEVAIPPGRTEEFAAQQNAMKLQALFWQGAFTFADFFTALIGFILAMVVLPTEINRGVILSILPKPISREEYVFGKAMGIWIIVSGCFLVFALELFAIQSVFNLMAGRAVMDWHFIMAVALFPFKYATLVLIIMGLTLRMPEVPAGIIGVIFFAAGHYAYSIHEIAIAPNLHVIFGVMLRYSYWMIPHLSQVTTNILDRDLTMITNWNELWGWVWQITIYNMILLKMLSWLFRRRSL